MGTYGVQLVGGGLEPVSENGGGLGSALYRGVISFWFTTPWYQVPLVHYLPAMAFNYGGGINLGFTAVTSSQLTLAVSFSSSYGTTIGTVNFTLNVPAPNTDAYYQILHNLIISFDTSTNACQAYLDNSALPLLSQSWASTGAMNVASSAILFYAGPVPVLLVSWFGDFWFGSVASFVDMSVATNREKFINSDGTPVDLGANGQNPFGSAPQIYLHTTSSGSVTDFLSNKGTGGAWSGVHGQMGPVAPPATPASVSASQTGPSQATVSWSAGTGVAAADYVVEYTQTGTSWTRYVTGSLTAVFSLSNPALYSFKVAALSPVITNVGYAGQSPFSPIVSLSASVLATLADLFFSPVPSFVDFTVQANRRLFVSNTGGAQDIGANPPFSAPPPVLLSRNGTPASFAANQGRGGPFNVSGGSLSAGASNPPGSAYNVVTVESPASANGALGDYLTGNLYSFNPKAYTDNGTAKRWLRRWRALPGGSPEAKRFSALNIDMIQVGTQVPPGANPQVMLRWSDDGGHSWSDWRIQPVGQLGQTAANVKFNRLGSTRRFGPSDRIFELSSADPFSVAIVDADVDVS